jgi:hypothetical protein
MVAKKYGQLSLYIFLPRKNDSLLCSRLEAAGWVCALNNVFLNPSADHCQDTRRFGSLKRRRLPHWACALSGPPQGPPLRMTAPPLPFRRPPGPLWTPLLSPLPE